MKRILHTIFFLLIVTIIFAQSYPRKCTEEDIPVTVRQKYFDQVENNIQNFYMLLLELTGQEMKEEFISKMFIDNRNRHIPEFYLSEKKSHRLSPGQYLVELDKVLESFNRDELEFQVDNFNHDPDMFMMNMRSCYMYSEYDLTLKNNDKVVFKSRCKLTSFFPKANSHIRVQTMQVEPVRDIIAYKPTTTTKHGSSVIVRKLQLESNSEYVDLGLRVLWATCNLGASKPEEAGYYYAFGETVPKKTYRKKNSDTYKKKFMRDDFTNMWDISYSNFDAALSLKGIPWRTPSMTEMEELIEECNWQWDDKRKGMIITGPNGNSIFLPAGGFCDGEQGVNFPILKFDWGSYWSSSVVSDGYYKNRNAKALNFNKDGKIFYTAPDERYKGFNIRPVRNKKY